MASAMKGKSTSFNDGAPEYVRFGPNQTKEFQEYWDSNQRVKDGKARKAAWSAMDPNEARSIRRARRKQLKAERLRNSRPEAAQRMTEGAERVRGRLAQYRADKAAAAAPSATAAFSATAAPSAPAAPASVPPSDKQQKPTRMAGDVFNESSPLTFNL